MFKTLIKVIERLVSAQEEANRINREYIAYRIKEEQEAKELSKVIRAKNDENELKAREINEELIKIANGRIQKAFEDNNAMLVRYIEQRLKEVTDKE